jgi:hypothetical protein
MGASRNFQDKDDKPREKAAWVCPQCGKTVHLTRRYCNCRADLRGARVRLSAAPPEVGPCNFESPNITCNDCLIPCAWCAGFGVMETNGNGFGGKGCQHKNTDARCYCCQSQVEIIGKLTAEVNIAQYMHPKTGEEPPEFLAMMSSASELALTKMEEPVLARIKHLYEKAG